MFNNYLSSSDLYRDSRLFQGIELFNKQQWYHCHDTFESIWFELSGNERAIIQLFLQITVACLHIERGNSKGAAIILGESLASLKSFNSSGLGIDLNSLRDLAKIYLKILQKSEQIRTLHLICLKTFAE
uniref:DUF309 domain-containing protein n=1 Tax=Paulinella chromatophora TaxID=39717 RepID=B1X445_PAUCH|nr:hypothetical protein PCC_0265 [Paulinella chromatophora]ACB42714.1 hypothetical protein PCC_0265 [Paulinella chromatophora]